MEEILERVQKPSRYTGGEWNEIKKDPKSVKTKVALAFPDLYEVGMSYIGQKILYFILNAQPDILAERVFSPWLDYESELRKGRIPLVSIENKIPLYQFDIVGFSLLYELNYSNILTILDLGGIPLLSSERKMEHPLVIGGGPAAFNPDPIADFFDLFVIGDGEEAFLEVINAYGEAKKRCLDRALVLEEMTQIQGVYVPSAYSSFRPVKSPLLAVRPKNDAPKQIHKRLFQFFASSAFPHNIVVPNTGIVFDRIAIEIARGCPQNCRFCQARSVYFPYRAKNPQDIAHTLIQSIRSTGYEDCSLAGLSVGDYYCLTELVKGLMDILPQQQTSLSLPSLRPKGLTSEIAQDILKVRKTGFTIVPEAGTERMRRVINKHLRDDELWTAVKSAFSLGWKRIKMYFMVGLPTEKEEDLQGIVNIVREVVRIGYKVLKRSPQINLSVASFIPKPHTPFQWLPMDEEKSLREKHHYLRKEMKKYPFVRFREHRLKSSILEAAFARGDRRLCSILFLAWKKGARFDSWNDQFDFSKWEETFVKSGTDFQEYLSELDREAPLPWDHISTGIKKAHLLCELEKALNEEHTLPCTSKRCPDCQGCDFQMESRETLPSDFILLKDSLDFLGDKTKFVFRYRVIYSKTERARYLSHMDLNNLIQRSFRRACIGIEFSKGFHPKMLISFAPALPLGAEGKNEVMEFKSRFDFSKKEFLSRINSFLLEGVRFKDMVQLPPSSLPLSESIDAIEYSISLETPVVQESLNHFRKQNTALASDDFQATEVLAKVYVQREGYKSGHCFKVDRPTKRLVLILKHKKTQSISPSRIFEEIFGLQNAAFLLSRDRILLRRTKKKKKSS